MTPSPRKPHHHGNLRAALVRAGIDLLEDGGLPALTLRACAARAGVSHAAPAHHFDGLAGLKGAIASEGMRIFRNYMLDAAMVGDQTPRGRLRSICRGYLSFARDNRALFDLIFGFDAASSREPGLRIGHSYAYQVLREACAPFVGPGQDRSIVETQVWALIHGYATLFLSGRLFLDDPGEAETGPFDQVMALLDSVGLPE